MRGEKGEIFIFYRERGGGRRWWSLLIKWETGVDGR